MTATFLLIAVIVVLAFVLPGLMRRFGIRAAKAAMNNPAVAARIAATTQGAVTSQTNADGSVSFNISVPSMQTDLMQAAQGVAGTQATDPVISPDLAVAEVISVSSAATGSPVLQLELDAIGEPKRRVSAEPPAGQTFQRGDRLYVLKTAADPTTVTMAPPSMTGGQTLPEGANRLDALVLGPQILAAGAKGKGVVKSATSIPLANPALAGRGFSKWELVIEVTPERGWPYTADLTISLSTPEKAAAIAHAGAEVPIRYDPEDTKTIAIDSIAMGYGDPYAAFLASVVQPSSTTVKINALGGHDIIEQIKMLRVAQPGLSLKAAKDIVEQTMADNLSADSLRQKIADVRGR